MISCNITIFVISWKRFTVLFGIRSSVGNSGKFTVFILQKHRGLIKSQKLCLNLCLLKWDRLIRSLISNSNPTWLWIPSVRKCNDWRKLGLKILTNFFTQFLRIGTILGLFHWSGDIPGCRQLSSKVFNYFKINLWDILNILIEISLYLWALLISKDFRVFKISDSFVLIELNNDVVTEALFNISSLKLFY